MVDAVFVVDREGRLILTNAAASRLFGIESFAGIGNILAEFPGLFQLRRPDGQPIASEEMALARALAGQTVAIMDQVVHNQRLGQDRYVRLSAAPIRDAEGGIVGGVAVARDVTELTELDRLKDQFIEVAAHELKTPVAIMKGYAEVLLRAARDHPPEHHRILEAIDRGADRIDRLVRDLLDVSELHLGNLVLRQERVDLTQVVEEVVDKAALTARRHRVRLVNADQVTVWGDRDRLGEVTLTLVDNAVRYSPQGGDVEVSVTVQDHEAVVSVRDQGVGIPEDKQWRIFERFYRAHTGTPYDYGGMGVGLYIAREIVARQGGRMWFESREGLGSAFHFSLPLG
jgi:PAS domain S-box-containing protein